MAPHLARGGLADPEEARMNAQYQFLGAVARCVPEVMETLLALDPASLTLTEIPYAEGPPRWRGPLPAELEAWAARWHLTAPWCLDFAIDSLRAGKFCYRPYFVAYPGWLDHTLHADPAATFSFSLHGTGANTEDPLRTYHPARELRGRARTRILAAFSDALDDYLDRMEAQARERGYVPPLRKRAVHSSSSSSPALHSEWLARHHCDGESYQDIAQSEIKGHQRKTGAPYFYSVQAVTQAVQRAARRAGLPLWRGRGRPRGSRDRFPRERGR